MVNQEGSLSAQDQSDLAHVLGFLEHARPHAIDLADDAQHRFFLRQMRNSGANEQDNPMFFRTVEAARADALAGNRAAPEVEAAADAEDDSLFDVNQINSFGTALAGGSVSSAFSSIVGGTIYTGLNLEILDGSTGQSLGSVGLPTVYGEGEYEALQLSGGAPSNRTMQSIFTYSYQKSGQAPVFNTVRFTTVESPLGSPTVTAPVLLGSHAGNASIKVGIGRDPNATPPDCDYWYYETNIDTPNLRLPLVGTQKFQSNIVQPLFNGSTPQNVMFACVISKDVGGGSTLSLPITNTNLQNNIKVSTSDPTVLTWTFPWAPCISNTPSYCQGPPLPSIDGSAQFGSAAWARDTNVMLSMSIAVKTATSGGAFVPVSVYSAATGPYGPQDNGVYVAQPIFYTWHCVAAGTRITLANGSTMTVEDIRGGEQVVTDESGTIFTVVDTFGMAKDGEILVLRTEAGHELLITDGHPVLTPNGHVRSEQLRAGDVVLTDRGPSKVTSIDAQIYKGRVHSFSLGCTKDEEQRFTDDNTNYYANGVLIGDNRIARGMARQHRRRLETILSKIPQEWHEEAKRNHARQLAR